MTDSQQYRPYFSSRLLWAGVGATVAAAVVLYGIAGGPGKETVSACSADVSRQLAPFARGQLAALNVPANPKQAVPISFLGPDGARLSLADFKGRAVLLNLWATWCLPCREEMPALDSLQSQLGDADFEVVAVSIDTARLERRRTFLEETGIKSLAFYADPTADSFQTLKRAGKALGLPTTILIDSSGCEVGVMAGPADWAADDSIALIRSSDKKAEREAPAVRPGLAAGQGPRSRAVSDNCTARKVPLGSRTQVFIAGLP
jgi:thiol-disulfide isomerase/thioredoxin